MPSLPSSSSRGTSGERQPTPEELQLFQNTLSRSAGGTHDGRKRKLTPQEEYDLSQCLSQLRVPDERIRRLWNLATQSQEDPPHVSEKMLKHRVKTRLASAQECFVLRHFKPEDSEEKTLPVLIGSLVNVLRFAAAKSESWRKLITEAVETQQGPRKVTCVLYADEIVCGNIIQQMTQKKITAVYCTLKEARRHAIYPDAWLMLACVQAGVLRQMSGGLSALMAAVVSEICSEETQTGFPVDCGDMGVKWVAIESECLYLADLDACKGAYGLKGSAGVVPCLWCSNVLGRSCGITLDGFVGVEEADTSKFVRRTDHDVFNCVDEMSRIESSSALELRQKVLGLHFLPEGVLGLRDVRLKLPPSACMVDAYHAYFLQGVASWEIGEMKEILHKQGYSLETLRCMALEHEWHIVGQPHATTEATVRRYFGDRNFGSGNYKADGHEVWSMVFLFWFYVHELLFDKDDCAVYLRSFALLREVCQELRFLRYEVKPVLTIEQTAHLERLQVAHQAACLAAYGVGHMRPKHHNRLHLGESIRKLSWLPLTVQHEKKHQLIKGTGMLDNQRGKLSASLDLQKSLLPRCLIATLESADEFGLCSWDLVEPTCRASTSLEDALLDRPMTCSTTMRLGPRQLTRGDVVQWREHAGVCNLFLRGKKVGFLMDFWELRLKARRPWGDIWCRTGRTILVRPSADISFKLAPWRRTTGEEIWTL